MPIYEYQCQSCQHALEALQKISDDPLTDCPSCGKPELRKKISAAAFRLKGGGWYETDFKTGGKKNLAGDSDSSKNASGDSKSAGGDSKKADSSSSAGNSAGNSASNSTNNANAAG